MHERILQRQEEHWAARGQAPGGAALPATPMDTALAQLKDLGALKASGVLTDAEFEAQKARILDTL